MRLFELFDQDKATVNTIGILISRLKDKVDQGHIDTTEYTVNDLLNYFQTEGITLDKDDLLAMLKLDPLKTLIKDIKGDKVEFVGQGAADALNAPEDEQEKVVAKMAKSAMK